MTSCPSSRYGGGTNQTPLVHKLQIETPAESTCDPKIRRMQEICFGVRNSTPWIRNTESAPCYTFEPLTTTAELLLQFKPLPKVRKTKVIVSKQGEEEEKKKKEKAAQRSVFIGCCWSVGGIFGSHRVAPPVSCSPRIDGTGLHVSVYTDEFQGDPLSATPIGGARSTTPTGARFTTPTGGARSTTPKGGGQIHHTNWWSQTHHTNCWGSASSHQLVRSDSPHQLSLPLLGRRASCVTIVTRLSPW